MQNAIFLTGGSGFIGRQLIAYFRQRGYKVFAIARSKASANVMRECGAYAVPGNLYNHTALKNTMGLCQVVVHAAALMRLWGDPREFYTTNVEGTRAVLDAAEEAGIKKFIYIGAASVINGKAVHNVDESYLPKKLPTDLYSETKYQAELAVLAANSNNMQTIVLRPPFVWGPDSPHIDVIRDVIEKNQFRWIGAGRHALSTCHVDNLAAAIVAAIHSDRGGAVYYVTDGETRPFRDFMSKYAQAMDYRLGDKTVPRWFALVAAKSVQFIWSRFKLKSQPPLLPVMIYLLGTNMTVSDQKARVELEYQNQLTIDEGFEKLATRD